jgi:predicted ATPase
VFRRARRTLQDELGLDPGPELQELQRAILQQDPMLRIEPSEVRARRHLPAPPTALVGRRRELTEVGSLLRGLGPRLVTLTGAGGIGKTRLGLQIAHELADAFDDGVFFVDLAHLRRPDLVPSALASALGVDEQPGCPLTDTLEAYLRRRRLLLLLDNFEVVDEAAPLLGELLQAAPGLALLVTSRAPLRLAREHEFRVSPLPLSIAVRLFAERARAVAPGFRRPSEETEEVSELCRRLDCLPLAIELAAARTRDYAPAELLRLFPGSLELASDGARDLPGRHRALRATIDWSYELLADAERPLFARLAIFSGGCTPAAAEAVCGAPRSALASLVHRSLLHERPGAGGEPRYLMLETVREYALERLAETGGEAVLARRHAEHFAELAEAVDRQPPGPDGERAWSRLEEEQDNLRAALDWSHDAAECELELRLVGALAYFWVVQDHLNEGRGRLEAVRRYGDSAPAPLRARVLFGAARLMNTLGDYEQMQAFAEESLAVNRSLGDQQGIAQSLRGLAMAARSLGDLPRGVALDEESAAICRAIGDDLGLAISLNNLGDLLLGLGEHERARGVFEEARDLFEALGARRGLSLALSNIGLAALLDDQLRDALAQFRRGLALACELEYTETLINGLEGVAAALAATGAAETAATLLGAAEAAADQASFVLDPIERRIHDRTSRALQDVLDEDAFERIHTAGRQLTPADAAALALGEHQPRVTA